MSGRDDSLLLRLQVCFALILCFIRFYDPRGRTLEAWHGGPNRGESQAKTHSPGLGPVADRRGILSLFLGVRDMPQEELPALDAGQLS